MKLNTAVTAVATIVASSMMMSSTDAFAGVNSQLSLHPQTKSVRNTSGMLQMVASNEVEDVVKPRKTRQQRLEAASKGLQVHVVGLSIHHADVNVREKLAVPAHEWNDASNEICSTGVVAEAAVLSTCNRFEVYYAATDAREAMARVTEYLAERGGLSVSTL